MTLIRLAVAALLLAASPLSFAQAYPDKSRPIRLVVPFGAGSGTDVVVRAYSRALNEQAGLNSIVDNKPGAEGMIGVEFVKNAAPDGYTVLLGNLSTHVLNVHMQAKLPYDPVADFVPVTAVENLSLVLNTGPSTKFASLKELLDAARAEPGKYSFGSGSASTRLVMEMLEHLAGIKLLSVPYKTQAQAAAGLAGGEVDLLVTDVVTAQPYYANGRLRPLGATGRTRLSALPNVPTFREQGVADFEFAAWHAFFVPARTPPDVVEKLAALLRTAGQSKYVGDALATKASDPMDMDTARLTTLLRDDIDRWGKLLRDMKKQARP